MRKGCDGGQPCGRCAKSGIGADGCILETQVQGAASPGDAQAVDEDEDDGDVEEEQDDNGEVQGQLERLFSTEEAQINNGQGQHDRVDSTPPQADQELDEDDPSWPFPIPGQVSQRPFDLSALHEDSENEYPDDGGIESSLQMDGSSFEPVESDESGGMAELNSSFLPRVGVDGTEDFEQAKQVNENFYQTVAAAADRRWKGRLQI